MPQNITDANAYTAPIVAPVDGEAGSAASVLTAFQGLSNRTNYIMQMLGGGTGFSRNAINGFAGLNASGVVITGLLPQGANGVCILDASSFVPSANIPFGVANKVPQLDGSSRLPAATARNGLISMAAGVFGTVAVTYATTTSASLVDVSVALVTLASSAAGDVVRFSASMPWNCAGSGGTVALTILDGASTVDYQKVPTQASTSGIAAFCGQYTVVNGGTITVKLRHLNLGGVASNAVGQISVEASLFRP